MHVGRLILSNGFFAKAAVGLFFSMAALATARADVYQDAITRAFPGFQILSRSEFLPEIRQKVKGNPGLITGRFNDDELEDFAAIIRGDVKKKFGSGSRYEYDYFDGKFVVCHGSGTGQYRCQVLSEMPILLPYGTYVSRVSPGKIECDGKAVTIKRDAIGFASGNIASAYIYQPDGSYDGCVTAD
jgi:hypothetical protein